MGGAHHQPRSSQMMEHRWKLNCGGVLIVVLWGVLGCGSGATAPDRSAAVAQGQELDSAGESGDREEAENAEPILEWNQVFIDTLIATNTANSSSQRLGAIVHTAIFDAYNGIERRYTPIFLQSWAERGASRRAAIVAAAHTALVSLFPSQQAALDARYGEWLAAL